MASEEQKQLASAIAPLMKDSGFKKSRFNWHRNMDNVVQVLNLQGSQWSKSMYVNLGIYFLEIGSEEKPLEHDCHVRERLTGVSTDLARCNELCDFENTIPELQRYQEIAELIQDAALPWLARCSTKEGARKYIQSEKKHGLPVSIDVKKYLGLSNN